MANRVPTLLATAVAAACSLSAHAEEIKKPATGCTAVQTRAPSQDNFEKVVLYADVTIAKDSVCEWGIWEELEPTAAGPQTPLPLLASAGEPYRPLSVVTPSQPQPQPQPQPQIDKGVLMGFGVITYQSFSNESIAQPDALVAAPLLNMGFRLTPTEVPPTVAPPTAPSNWLPAAMTIATQGIRSDVSEQAPTFTAAEIGVLNFDGINAHRTAGGEGASASASMATDTAEFSEANSGKFTSGQITSYINGGQTVRMAEMHGFWGVTTSATEMNAVRLANSGAAANYSGYTFGADGNPTGVMNIAIQFGPGTFVADFGAAAGQSLNVANPLQGTVVNTQSGVKQINGTLIFQASGTLNGSQLISNSVRIAGANNSITGKVEGALFGSQAQVAAGVADVTATLGGRSTTPAVNGAVQPAKLVNTGAVTARYSTAYYATQSPVAVNGVEK